MVCDAVAEHELVGCRSQQFGCFVFGWGIVGGDSFVGSEVIGERIICRCDM